MVNLIAIVISLTALIFFLAPIYVAYLIFKK
jgi:hypothetical protein